jgi:hypothetical protein
MFNNDVKDIIVDEIMSYAKEYSNWREDDYDNLYADDVDAILEFNLNGLDYCIKVNMAMYVYLTHYPGDYLTPPEVSEEYRITIYNISMGVYNKEADEDTVEDLLSEDINKIEKEVNEYINR